MVVQECFTVKEVAKILKLTEDAVLALIRRGDLPASNINTRADAQRPRWRVSDADVGRFLLKTRHSVPVSGGNRKRSRPATSSGKDYFA